MAMYDRNGRLIQTIITSAGIEAFRSAAKAVMNEDPAIGHVEIRHTSDSLHAITGTLLVIEPELPWD